MKKFEDIAKNFEKMKKELKDIDSSEKTSGIYMLYIDDLIFDNLIPLYIGQSVNLYNRKSAHRGNAKKLFILSTEDYNKRIPLNSGKYLYCKLVSTLRNNNKTLEDIKFKVLEHCDKEKLDEREKYWIDYFEAPIYCFNQFDEVIESNKIKGEILFSKEKLNYNKIIQKGIITLENFQKRLQSFDETLLKYRYYSVNYTLLIGNCSSLHNTLSNIKSIDLDNDISEKLNITLEETKVTLKYAIALLMSEGCLKLGTELFKEFEIK